MRDNGAGGDGVAMTTIPIPLTQAGSLVQAMT